MQSTKKSIDNANLAYRLRTYNIMSIQAWQNLPMMLYSYSLQDLKNTYKGRVAVVVAAGKSMEKVLPFLKTVKKDLIVISAGSAIGGLARFDIVPDFQVAVDPFLGGENEILPFLKKDTNLVLPFYFSPKMALMHQGRTYFYKNLQEHKEAKVLHKISDFLKTDFLLTSLNVAVTAVGLALYLGCEKIVLLGVDLAILDVNQQHAKGVLAHSYDDQKNFVNVMGQKGEFLKTPKWFKDTIETFSFLAKKMPEKFINASVGGALIEGMLHMNFADVVQNSLKDKIMNKQILKKEDLGIKKAINLLKTLEQLLEKTYFYKERCQQWFVKCWNDCVFGKSSKEDRNFLKEMEALKTNDFYCYLLPMLTIWEELLFNKKIHLSKPSYLLVFLSKVLWALDVLEISLKLNLKSQEDINICSKEEVQKKILANYNDFNQNVLLDEHGSVNIDFEKKTKQLMKVIILGNIYCVLIQKNSQIYSVQILLKNYVDALMQLLDYLSKQELKTLQFILGDFLEIMEKKDYLKIVKFIQNDLQKNILYFAKEESEF